MKCPKCGSKRIDRDKTQFRFYYKCLDCGNLWKRRVSRGL